MSGGSLNYEYSRESPSAGHYRTARDAMKRIFECEMAKHGGGNACTCLLLERMSALIEHLEAAQKLHEDPSMQKSMHAIEWMLSGDYDEDGALQEILEAFGK